MTLKGKSKTGSKEVFKRSNLQLKRNVAKSDISELKESKIEMPFSWDAACRI